MVGLWMKFMEKNLKSKMSYFRQPVLLMFLGSPGSGKSYFARQAAEKMNAVRFNGDSMRLSIFESLDAIKKVYESDSRQTVNSYVFNAIDYATTQVLARGLDVVYDAHHNKRSDRTGLEKIAVEYNAVPVLVWVKTPYEIALKRIQTRAPQIDQRQMDEEHAKEVMVRHQKFTDEPDANEKVIILDGQVPFQEQFVEFEASMAEILAYAD